MKKKLQSLEKKWLKKPVVEEVEEDEEDEEDDEEVATLAPPKKKLSVEELRQKLRDRRK